MSLDEERAAVRLAHLAWGAGDLEGMLTYFDEDVVYQVNVDGMAVPYAASAVGKEDVRQRLTLLLHTFVVDAFVVDQLVHEPDFTRTVVFGYYKHKATGERLDIKVRFKAWVVNGLIVRVEEWQDKAYVEAFERFVFHLQNAAVAAGNNNDASPKE